MQHLQPKSLICLDELGATTSPDRSLPPVWATCEFLLARPNILTVMSTHNQWLFKLQDYYCTVRLTLNEWQIAEEADLVRIDGCLVKHKKKLWPLVLKYIKETREEVGEYFTYSGS